MMDDVERDLRNARAIGCFYRVKRAIGGTSVVLLGALIVAWLRSENAPNGRDPGPWPWVAVVGCSIAGPALLWQAFRRR